MFNKVNKKALFIFFMVLFLNVGVVVYCCPSFCVEPVIEEQENKQQPEKDKKILALTFDDGPSRFTGALLDGLKNYGVQATFFVTGVNGPSGAAKHPDLIERMWQEGHEIGNHTYNHMYLNQLTPNQIKLEVKRTEKIVFDVVGGKYKCIIRTPFGRTEKVIRNSVRQPIVGWNVDIMDWKHRDADYVCKQIVKEAKNGSIVLLHDVHKTSVDGALCAVDILKNDGWEFVTVAELMRRSQTKLKDGFAYNWADSSNVDEYLEEYEAPKIQVTKSKRTKENIFVCGEENVMPIYYTTDGTYPKLSDNKCTAPVILDSSKTFTAIGVDKWGTRTPAFVWENK